MILPQRFAVVIHSDLFAGGSEDRDLSDPGDLFDRRPYSVMHQTAQFFRGQLAGEADDHHGHLTRIDLKHDRPFGVTGQREGDSVQVRLDLVDDLSHGRAPTELGHHHGDVFHAGRFEVHQAGDGGEGSFDVPRHFFFDGVGVGVGVNGDHRHQGEAEIGQQFKSHPGKRKHPKNHQRQTAHGDSDGPSDGQPCRIQRILNLRLSQR